MRRLIIILLLLSLFPALSFAIPAFPGCEGWGCATTTGGRGGTVCKVTRLADDSNPGSLRYCLTRSYTRYIIFTTGGTITLNSDIWATNPNVTLAGQTAPGGGIQVRNGAIRFTGYNVIMRGMKLRAGDGPGDPLSNRDSFGVEGSDNHDVVIDHNSFEFGADETATLWNQVNGHRRVTWSYNIMAYPLVNCSGCATNHGFLNLFGGSDQGYPHSIETSIHHNLYSTSQGRLPLLKQNTHAEVINNVIYNGSTSYGSHAMAQSSWVGNYWKDGPLLTNIGLRAANDGEYSSNLTAGSIYMAHNICNQRPTDSGDETLCFRSGASYYGSSPPDGYPLSSMTIDSPTDAYSKVLGSAGSGAGAYHSDSLDTTVINEVLNNTGRSSYCSSEECYGGYPTLSAGTPPTDTDGDGMPDTWEQANGTNYQVADANGDINGDGYTNIEEWINSFFPLEGAPIDTTPPDRYNGTPGSLPSGTTETDITLTTNEAATCRYSTTPGTDFSSMTNIFSGGGTSSHSATVGATTYTDDFNRADGSLGANWTQAGTASNPLAISSNKVYGSANLNKNAGYYSAATFPDDQRSCLVVDDDSIGVLVRTQPGQTNLTGYNFREGHPPEEAGLLILRRYDTNGSGTVIDSVAGTVSPGDEICLEAEGNTLTTYINDVAVPGLTTTDSTFSGGYPGIYSFVNTVGADNWSGGGLNPLADGNIYDYYVRCIDEANNVNTDDFLISFGVQGGGGGGTPSLGSFTIQGVIQ